MAATVKKDNVLLTFSFAIMIIRVASTGTQLQAPYSLVFTGTRDGPRGNYLTFSCQTSQHLNLNNAEFYRNGAREDSCLAKYATEFSNGSMRMNITPACEGYFQCGRNNVLSSPEPVYAFPEYLKNSSFNITTIESFKGDNITLPCAQSVSGLNSFTVEWIKLDGQIRNIEVPANKDYSLTLRNLKISHSGKYYCRVRTNKLTSNNVELITLSGPEVTLVVKKRHVNPQLTTNITHSTNTKNQHIFRVDAKGTPSLYIKWFLRDKFLNGSTQVEIFQNFTTNVIGFRGEIILGSLPQEVSELSVVVSNKDSSGAVFIATQHLLILTNSSPCDNYCRYNYSIEGFYEMNAMAFHLSAAVVGALLLFQLVIIMGLSIAVHNLRQRPCLKSSNSTSTTNSSEDTGPSYPMIVNPQGGNTPLEAPPPPPPQFNRQNTEVVQYYNPGNGGMFPGNGGIHPLSSPLIHDQFPNPVAAILIKIGYLYRNSELTDTTFIKTLQHILVDVLDDCNIISSPEAVNCVCQLRDEIQKYNDQMRRRQFSRPCEYSRQATIGSTHRGSLESTTPVIIEVEDSSPPLQSTSAPSPSAYLQVKAECRRGSYSGKKKSKGSNEGATLLSVQPKVEEGDVDETDGGSTGGSTGESLEKIEEVLDDFIKKIENMKKAYKSTKV